MGYFRGGFFLTWIRYYRLLLKVVVYHVVKSRGLDRISSGFLVLVEFLLCLFTLLEKGSNIHHFEVRVKMEEFSRGLIIWVIIFCGRGLGFEVGFFGDRGVRREYQMGFQCTRQRNFCVVQRDNWGGSARILDYDGVGCEEIISQ